MYLCKDCSGPVEVTRNPDRVTLPKWHVSCPKCPAERNVNIVESPVENGVFFV